MPILALKPKPIYEFLRSSLHVEPQATIENFQEIAAEIKRLSSGIQFWCGDFLVEAQKRFGEMASQFTDELGYNQETLDNFRWVAEKIPPELRRESLSFSIHREAAHLKNPVDIEAALEVAERDKLTVAQFREHLHPDKKSSKVSSIRIAGMIVEGKVSIEQKGIYRDFESGSYTAQEMQEAFE